MKIKILFCTLLFAISSFQGFSQSSLCAGASPICTATPYSFPAGVNAGSAESGPNYGCMYSEPNPAWCYLQIANSGDLTIKIVSSAGVDVDFACWGPFSSPTLPCTAQLTATCNPCNSDNPQGSYPYPYGNLLDCSYSTSATETCYIPNGITGQFYIIMATNFSNTTSNIVFSQTGGTGTTNCGIACSNLGNNGPLCPGQTLNLTANNVSGGTYAWTGPLGFTSILQNPTISNVTTANSGNYVCTVTVGGIAGQPCTTTVVVSPIPTVTASTASSVICNGDCVNLNGGGASTYSWMPGGATGVTVSVCPAATTTYTVTGTSFSGCTNSTTINVAVNPAYLFTETQGICNGASYNWHNNNYSIVGVYYDSLTTVQGCDSIYKLNLTMNPSYLMPTNVTICNGMAYHWRGSDYSTAGTYYDSLQTIQGCDSVLALNLSLNSVYAFTENQNICLGDTFKWHGTDYTTSTIDTVHYTSFYLCDSMLILHLTVNPLYAFTENHSICSGDTYNWYGTGYTSAGTYTANYVSINGCDSIYLLNLSVNPVNSINNPQTICSGNSYVINGHSYSSAGTYHDTLTTSLGCDSIIITQLTAIPPYTFSNPQTICNGSSYIFNGHAYTTGGIYHDTLTSVLGCDSIIVTQLTINPTYSINNPQTICNGSSYMFNGHTYTAGGIYHDTLFSALGCDSIIVTHLTVDPAYHVNLDSVNGGVNDTLTVPSYPIILNAGSGFQYYTWCNGGGSIQIIQVNAGGWYCVSVSSDAGCSDVDSIFVQLSIGIENIENANEVSLFPNPTNGKIKVQSTRLKIQSLGIYNMQGLLVKQIPNHQSSIELDVSALAKGIYLVKIQSENGIINKKLVIQ